MEQMIVECNTSTLLTERVFPITGGINDDVIVSKYYGDPTPAIAEVNMNITMHTRK